MKSEGMLAVKIIEIDRQQKATSVSVHLWIYSVRLSTANKLSGAVAGER